MVPKDDHQSFFIILLFYQKSIEYFCTCSKVFVLLYLYIAFNSTDLDIDIKKTFWYRFNKNIRTSNNSTLEY